MEKKPLNVWQELFAKNGLAHKDVAELLGVNYATLSQYIHGWVAMPKKQADTLMDLFKITDTQINDMIRECAKVKKPNYISDGSGFGAADKGNASCHFMTPLNELRMKHNITIKELAEKMGMTEYATTQMCNAKGPITPDRKERLMKIFDLGYAQVSDLANRMANMRPNGNLSDRKAIRISDVKQMDKLISNLNKEAKKVEPEIIDIKEDTEMYVAPAPVEEKKSSFVYNRGDGSILTNKEESKPTSGRYPWGDKNAAFEEEPQITHFDEKAEGKMGVMNDILDLVYGKIRRSDYTSLEEVLKRYWL